jgi:hypothetical protein
MLGNVWGLIQAVNVLHPSAAGAASHKYPASADFVVVPHKYPASADFVVAPNTYLASADFVVVSDECWLSVEFVGASPCSQRLARAGACYQAARDD